METLWEAYRMARSNDGAPGIDGVTFEAIEESGAEGFLTQIRDELVTNTYRPMRARRKEIPKDGGTKVRVLLEKAVNTTREGQQVHQRPICQRSGTLLHATWEKKLINHLFSMVLEVGVELKSPLTALQVIDSTLP